MEGGHPVPGDVEPGPHLGQHVTDGLVPPGGEAGVHPLHGDALSPQRPQAQPGGGVAPSPLHLDPAGAVVGLGAIRQPDSSGAGTTPELGQGPEGRGSHSPRTPGGR